MSDILTKIKVYRCRRKHTLLRLEVVYNLGEGAEKPSRTVRSHIPCEVGPQRNLKINAENKWKRADLELREDAHSTIWREFELLVLAPRVKTFYHALS